MSTPTHPADRARKIMDEIASHKRDAVNDQDRAEAIYARIVRLHDELRELRPLCDELTQGQIDSTINPLAHMPADSMSQAADPRSKTS